MLQQGRKLDSSDDNDELEFFHREVTKLGITSSIAALTERRALKRLIERAREEEDNQKESIVVYLLQLMRKHSKLFKTEISDDTESTGPSPYCSPTVRDSIHHGGLTGGNQAFDQELSKISSFNFKLYNSKFKQIALPPEELRCPMSRQLMYDPVIIASGQTYERACIEKWFNDGHNSCPKTQQKLSNLSLTPNYCIKGMIASWCKQNGVRAPDGPPESLDLNSRKLDSSNSESTITVSAEDVVSGRLKEVKVVPLEESGPTEEVKETQNVPPNVADFKLKVFERHEEILHILHGEENLRKKCKVVEQIRFVLKDDEGARNFMGSNGFVEALLQFLDLAVHKEDVAAQEIGAMALFNLAVNNNRFV